MNLDLLYDLDVKKVEPRAIHYCMDVYPKYFSRFRDKPIRILEIGVKGGGSLRLWKRYFLTARIFGIDIKKENKFEEERIEVFTGNQSDTKFLREVMHTMMNEADIIIDDGSHFSEDQKISFEFLFPYLNPGGLYIIEDLFLSYNKKWNGGLKKEGTIVEYLKDLVDFTITSDNEGIMKGEGKEIESIHFHKSLVVIRKKE